MADKVKIFFTFGAWVVLGLLLYAKTFHAPFLFDDEILIVHNPKVQDLMHGFESFKNIYSYQPSRIFTNLTVALNFHFGQLNTFGYHLFNWIVHILVTCGVWYFTRMLVAIKQVKSSVDIPFWASMIFFVHPLHTESVSYINHRSSLLVTLFYIWSVIFYLKARMSLIRPKAWVYFVGAGITAGLSLLSKESGWTLPLAWVAADMMLLNRRPKKSVWVAFAIVLVGVLLIFDFKIKDVLMAQVYSQSHRGDFLTLGTYLLTQLRVCVVFIRLIFFPVGLNADYDFPMSHSLWEPQTAAAGAFLLLLCIGAYLWRHRCWFWAWSVALLMITLLSHFFPARYNVIAEHKLYLPLAMVIPVMTLWLLAISKERFMVVAACIIACFSLLTLQRNDVWADPIRLWQDTSAKSPHKPRPYLNLGAALLAKGQVAAAEQIFLHLIRTAPEYCESYVNLAQIEMVRGNLEKALLYSEEAVKVNPTFEVANLQNGFLHDRLGHRDQAIKRFKFWLSVHPNDIFIINRIRSLKQQN